MELVKGKQLNKIVQYFQKKYSVERKGIANKKVKKCLMCDTEDYLNYFYNM